MCLCKYLCMYFRKGTFLQAKKGQAVSVPCRMPCGMPLSVIGSWGNILDHDCDGLPLAGSLSIYLRPPSSCYYEEHVRRLYWFPNEKMNEYTKVGRNERTQEGRNECMN